MRPSPTEEMMEEAKLWTGRERHRGSPDEDEDESPVGAAGGSETEACLGDEEDERPGVPSGSATALPIYVSMHR